MKKAMSAKTWMAVMALAAGMATSASAFGRASAFSRVDSLPPKNEAEMRQAEEKRQRIAALVAALLRTDVKECEENSPADGNTHYSLVSLSRERGLRCMYLVVGGYYVDIWNLPMKDIVGGDIAVLSIQGGDDYLVYRPFVRDAESMADLQTHNALYSEKDIFDAINTAAAQVQRERLEKRAKEDLEKEQKAAKERLEAERNAIEELKRQMPQGTPDFDR